MMSSTLESDLAASSSSSSEDEGSDKEEETIKEEEKEDDEEEKEGKGETEMHLVLIDHHGCLPGLDLTGFLFGNVDGSGRLDSDSATFLDVDTRERMGGLAAVINAGSESIAKAILGEEVSGRGFKSEC